MTRMSYICGNCKTVFSEPNYMILLDRNLGSAAYIVQPTEVCPACHSQDIGIARKCEVCDAWHDEGDMSAWSDTVCVRCLARIVGKVKTALSFALPMEEYNLMVEYLSLNDPIV